MTPVEHTVLRLLKQAAAEGRICPTNSELAAAAGITGWFGFFTYVHGSGREHKLPLAGLRIVEGKSA